MKSLAIVALGGALGATARYLVIHLSTYLLGHQFPYGTLIVNILGSFIMGILIETMALVWSASSEMRLFLSVGILGAFTTFSSFSLDVAVLYERGRLLVALWYVLSSVAFSICALFAGLALMRRILA